MQQLDFLSPLALAQYLVQLDTQLLLEQSQQMLPCHPFAQSAMQAATLQLALYLARFAPRECILQRAPPSV